jgi:hypothetical protein
MRSPGSFLKRNQRSPFQHAALIDAGSNPVFAASPRKCIRPLRANRGVIAEQTHRPMHRDEPVQGRKIIGKGQVRVVGPLNIAIFPNDGRFSQRSAGPTDMPEVYQIKRFWKAVAFVLVSVLLIPPNNLCGMVTSGSPQSSCAIQVESLAPAGKD